MFDIFNAWMKLENVSVCFFERNETCKKNTSKGIIYRVHPKCIKNIITWTNVMLTNFLMKFKNHKQSAFTYAKILATAFANLTWEGGRYTLGHG